MYAVTCQATSTQALLENMELFFLVNEQCTALPVEAAPYARLDNFRRQPMARVDCPRRRQKRLEENQVRDWNFGLNVKGRSELSQNRIPEMRA